ncbi:hypothetical protein ANN_22559 [Periplaneta americana]|uniref:Per a allergen n=1 Tax=Periplaneta americana TaxID=6978 RepID=A0ABQ8S8S6_PERAM|nr:hypothetical protein ANN_22559 [Periplaneta americana]
MLKFGALTLRKDGQGRNMRDENDGCVTALGILPRYLGKMITFSGLDDRPPLLRHVDVRPASGSSVLALHGL